MKEYNLTLTPELAYIIGSLLGDGSNEKKAGRLKFGVKNYNFINKIKKNLKKQFQKSSKITKRENNGSFLYHIAINSKFISHNIEQKIKEIKTSKSKEILCAFLEGAFDSEGNVDKKRLRIRLAVKSKKYIDMVSYSLNFLNVKHTLKKDKNKLWWIRIYSYECIKFHNLVHFSIKYREENLKKNIQNFNEKKEYNNKKRQKTLILKEKNWCKEYNLTRNQYYRYKRKMITAFQQ